MTARTRLDVVISISDGIYESQGGGQERVYATFTTGPRNNFACGEAVMSATAYARRTYGNMGAGVRVFYTDAAGRIDVTGAVSLSYQMALTDGQHTIRVADWRAEADYLHSIAVEDTERVARADGCA